MLTATFASPTGFATGSLVSGTAEIVVTTPSEQNPRDHLRHANLIAGSAAGR